MSAGTDGTPARGLHPKTVSSATIQALKERPQTKEELGHTPDTVPQRDVVCRLGSPNQNANQPHGHGRATTVYYLWGDDRRGVRRFIDVNQAFVASVLDGEGGRGANLLSTGWDDVLYSLLVEEWQLFEDGDSR